jgi:hypothetical protein
MSRIAEASARAGRAVPDNSRVDWAREREAAHDLLSGTAPQETARPSRPTLASSPRSVDSIDQTFPWPPKIDLDEIDLSRDANALNFRRPWARKQTARDQRRLEFDDQTPGHHSQVRHESAASSQPPSVSSTLVPPRVTAASPKRVAGREPGRAEARRVTPRWVVVAVALIVVLASLALLTYFLRNRQVATDRHAPAPLEAPSGTNKSPERDSARTASEPSLNAMPWAQMTIDGNMVGETPLAL